MFKEITVKKCKKRGWGLGFKKQLTCVALGGVTGHQMAAALLPVHEGGCTYLLWDFNFILFFIYFLV